MLLVQTRTTAALTIIIMLLGAGLIGYLTTYFYYKSVYTRKINALEKEIGDLNSRIIRLNSDKGDLEKRLKSLEEDLAKMKDKNKKKA